MHIFNLSWFVILLILFGTISCSIQEHEQSNLDRAEMSTRTAMNKMSIKKLREMITEQGLQCKNCIEKEDMVEKLIEHFKTSQKPDDESKKSTDEETAGKTCTSDTTTEQLRYDALKSEIATMKEEIASLQSVVNKLVHHAKKQNADSKEESRNQKPRPSDKIDMNNGNMVNGKFYHGRTYSDDTGNVIYGVGNTVTGLGNSITGSNNQVSGSNNVLRRSNMLMTGSGNQIG